MNKEYTLSALKTDKWIWKKDKRRYLRSRAKIIKLFKYYTAHNKAIC